MIRLSNLDGCEFLIRRAEQLIREGSYDAARRITKVIDEEQAERFRRLIRLRSKIAT